MLIYWVKVLGEGLIRLYRYVGFVGVHLHRNWLDYNDLNQGPHDRWWFISGELSCFLALFQVAIQKNQWSRTSSVQAEAAMKKLHSHTNLGSDVAGGPCCIRWPRTKLHHCGLAQCAAVTTLSSKRTRRTASAQDACRSSLGTSSCCRQLPEMDFFAGFFSGDVRYEA